MKLKSKKYGVRNILEAVGKMRTATRCQELVWGTKGSWPKMSTHNRSIGVSEQAVPCCANFIKGGLIEGMLGWKYRRNSDVCRRETAALQYQDPHFTSFSWPLSTVIHSKRMIPARSHQWPSMAFRIRWHFLHGHFFFQNLKLHYLKPL